MMTMCALFPSFKPENKSQMIDTWLVMLGEYPKDEVFLALKSYIHSNNSGFAPGVSQLIYELEKPKEIATMDSLSAWKLVRVAIGRSTYGYVDEFNKLPPTIQKAIGGAEILHYWAMDGHFDEGVTMSQFIKNYNSVVTKQRDFERLPIEMKSRVQQFIEKCPETSDGALLITAKEPSKVEEKNVNNKPLGEYTQRVQAMFE